MSFSAISIRANGQDVDASWWNALRTAGVAVEAIVGGSAPKLVNAAMSPYSINPATDFYLIADASAGAVTLVAPSAAGSPSYAFKVKNKYTSVNPVTVTFADNCDNNASLIIPLRGAAEFQNDGTTYYAS